MADLSICERGCSSLDGCTCQPEPLFADFAEPLRGDLQYIEAALSPYWGGPADDDVRGAWDRILQSFRDVRADYMRVLQEKVDLIVAGCGDAARPAAVTGPQGRTGSEAAGEAPGGHK